MPLEDQRWDPSSPGFVFAVLRMMIGLGVAVGVVGTLVFPAGLFGFVTGALLAIAAYIIAMRAGNILARSGSYAQVMLWLLLTQFVLWVGMALLLAVVKVNPYGFVIGVSILPSAIVLTLVWYVLRRRKLPS